MKFAIFVLLYNPKWGQVSNTLKNYAEIFSEMVIVDNSTIENKEKVLDVVPNATYYWQGGNKGISKALDYAFKWSKEHKIDYLLTMDQDSDYKNVEIQNMLQYIEKNYDEKVGIYSVNYQNLYLDEKRNEFVAGKLAIKRSSVVEIKFCMTSGSFVNVSAVQKALPLDDFFVSYVDVDLCAWLSEHGYKLLRIGNSVLRQQVGENVKRTKYNMFFHVLHHKDIRYYFMVRNNFLFRKKYKNFKTLGIKRLVRVLTNIMLGERNKVRKIYACYLGYKDYKKGIYGNIPSEVQKLLI